MLESTYMAILAGLLFALIVIGVIGSGYRKKLDAAEKSNKDDK